MIVTCSIVGTTTFSAGWIGGRAYLGDQLDQYQRSESWHLPELLKNLGVVSKELSLSLAERKELASMQQSIAGLQRNLDSSRLQISSLQDDLGKAREELASMKVETFILNDGEARYIVPKEVAVGVKRAGIPTGEAEIQFAGQEHTVSAGATLEAIHAGKRYVLTVLEVKYERCKFGIAALEVTKP